MEKGGKKSNFAVRITDNNLSQAIGFVVTSGKSCWLYDISTKWWKWHVTSVVFLPRNHNPRLTMTKNSRHPDVRDILQDTWLVLLRLLRLSKTRKVIWETHSQELLRGGRRPNVLYSGWDLRTDKKDVRQKLVKI